MNFITINPPQNSLDEDFLQSTYKLIKKGHNIRVSDWTINDFDQLGGFFSWANFSYILNEIPNLAPTESSITACILTYNCETSIEHCLKNALRYANEIIVIDSESQDGTRTIVDRYTDKVLTVSNDMGFDEKRNLAITNVETEWLMMIDSDEVFPETGGENIRKLITWADREEIDIYWFSRYWLLRGEISPFVCKKGHLSLWPDPQARLIRTSVNPKYKNALHEQLTSTYAKNSCLVNASQSTILHFKYWIYTNEELQALLNKRQKIISSGPDDVQLSHQNKSSYSTKLPSLKITNETEIFIQKMMSLWN